MDGIGGANKGDKSRGSLGSKAPDGPSPGSAGVEDWVVGSRRCRPRPRRTLEPGQPRAVTSRKSCLVPPWLFCPGDGMGCAGSSSRSGAAWLAGGGGGAEALIPCQPACRVLSARLSMGPPSESYCSTITRTIIICADICRDKRGHGIQTHVCNAVSVVLCLVVMCYICMSTQCTACPGILNPEMEVQIDITARQHRPSCPSYQHQVGYCGIKLTRRVQAGKRGEVFASFLLVSPAPSCFACLLLFLLTVRVHPGMRIPARVFLNACLPARQPARQPAPASLTDGPACQQAYPTCSSPWTSVYKTKK